MSGIKHFILTTLIVSFCYSLTAQINSGPPPAAKVSKIIFHSSRCNGTCPQLALQVDSNRSIIVSREYFKTKSEPDSSRSGAFKGVLDVETYKELLLVLRGSNYRNLKFPKEYCCDRVISTIIVYDSYGRTYLKSINPPAEAHALISFLHKLTEESKLDKFESNMSIEE